MDKIDSEAILYDFEKKGGQLKLQIFSAKNRNFPKFLNSFRFCTLDNWINLKALGHPILYVFLGILDISKWSEAHLLHLLNYIMYIFYCS
jgi:hypothetical protein